MSKKYDVDLYNYTAIEVLEYLGYMEPTQIQIDAIVDKVRKCIQRLETVDAA